MLMQAAHKLLVSLATWYFFVAGTSQVVLARHSSIRIWVSVRWVMTFLLRKRHTQVEGYEQHYQPWQGSTGMRCRAESTTTAPTDDAHFRTQIPKELHCHICLRCGAVRAGFSSSVELALPI